MKPKHLIVAALAVALVSTGVAVLAHVAPDPLAIVALGLYAPKALLALAVSSGPTLLLAIPPAAAPITSKKIRGMQEDKAKLVAAMRAITDKADAEGRDLTAEEQKVFDEKKTQLTAKNNAIAREAELIAEEAALGVEVPTGTLNVHENAENDPKRGFVSIGHFAQAVREHPNFQGSGFALAGKLHTGGGPRAAAPTTFGSEGQGADGGFAVPPDFSREIFTHSLGEDSLLPLTDSTNVSGNSMVFPKDETTPWGTDGVRAYWQSEASQANATKPKLSTTTLRLYKLMALVPLTDELLADTNALDSYLPKKTGDSIRWKTNEAILFGSGAGQPLGAFNGNAVVTVAKEAGQATLTLQALNIAKMIARLPAGSYGRALWLINNDVIPALYTLTLGNYPIYMPISAGVQSTPYGALSGRPVLVSQHAKSFTNQGDVLLIDPQYVRAIQKAAGIQTATSMHLYFDADATAFRVTFRVDTQPKIVNPIAPFNGANNLSPFVQLGAR